MRAWACIKAWCEDTHYDHATRGNITQAAKDKARGKAAVTTKAAPATATRHSKRFHGDQR